MIADFLHFRILYEVIGFVGVVFLLDIILYHESLNSLVETINASVDISAHSWILITGMVILITDMVTGSKL